jgi:hypothetical protein
MKKILSSFGIILMVCLLSVNSYSQTVTAYCTVTYTLTDANYLAGDTYYATIRVITLYPTNTYASLNTPSFGSNPITNKPVAGVGLDSTPPVPADYYTIEIVIYKIRSGSFYERQSGTSYAGMSSNGLNYYLTANNQIDLYFAIP